LGGVQVWATCILLTLFTLPAHAELPQIRLERIFPLGGAAGSTIEFEITGRDLDDTKALHIDHPGIRAEWVKANQFRLTIAADVPPGVYDVRAVGKYGISAGRLFAVSRGLSEVLEKEPNDAPEQAQAVPFPVAINGQSDGNGDDAFRFPAHQGDRITIDAQAFRLDSTLRPTLSLSTAGGKELARSKPYYERVDALLDVVIPADGDYIVNVADATYSGGLPYRLVVSKQPLLENAFPCALAPGETAELTITGRNLPGGRPVEGPDVNGLSLEQVTLPVSVPADAPILVPLPSPSLNARTIQVRPKGLDDALNPLTLLWADAPVTREQEPNDVADKAQALTPDTYLAGRFDRPGDADWFSFTAKSGEALAIELFAERLDLPGDPRVIVTNEKGQELTSLDDHGIRFNSLDMYNRDPQGVFRAPADGRYRILVQDTYGAGGPRYVYALRVAKPSPDLFPVVFHETPIDPTCPVVRQGGSAFVQLCLNRRDEFNGPVTIEAENLPAGVTCPPTHVSPQTPFANVVFTAAPDAPEWSGPVRLKAVATIDGRRIERPVGCSQRRWTTSGLSRLSREIALAVRSKAPYGLKTPADPQDVTAGGTLETRIAVERSWPDFQGKVQVNGLDLPPGFSVQATEILEGKSEAPLRITVAANVPPGAYTLAFRGDAQVPFSPDPKAMSRPNVRVADPATPLTVRVQAPPKTP
jgi:hypothetical protein